jgi:hypothetical protein
VGLNIPKSTAFCGKISFSNRYVIACGFCLFRYAITFGNVMGGVE